MLEILFWTLFVAFALIGAGTVLILILMYHAIGKDAKEEREFPKNHKEKLHKVYE